MEQSRASRDGEVLPGPEPEGGRLHGPDEGSPILADRRWLAAIDDAYGARACRVAAAGLEVPGYAVRNIRGQRMFYGLPDSLSQQPVERIGDFLDAIRAPLRSDGFTQAWIDTGNAMSPAGLRRRVRISPVIDLRPGTEAIWRGFRDKVRNTIRKAERSAFVISDDIRHVDAFHALYASAMDEKGAAIRSRAFFGALLERFGAQAMLKTAWKDGLIRGGVLILRNGSGASYPYGAADTEGKRVGITSLLLWRAIDELCALGVPNLDLGPSAPGGGTYRFKIHLGGVPRERYFVDVLSRVSDAPAVPTAEARAPASRGKLERMLVRMPARLRIAFRILLGRFDRIL